MQLPQRTAQTGVLLVFFLGATLCFLGGPRVTSAFYSNLGSIELSRVLLSGLKPGIGTTVVPPTCTESSIWQVGVAEGYFVEALSWHASSRQAYYNLGRIHPLRADYGNAAELLTRSLGGNPDNVLAYWHLGNVYEAQGEHQKAIEAWRKARADSYFYLLAEAAANQHDMTEAIKQVQLATQVNPDSIKYRRALGFWYEGQAEWNKAIAEYKAARDLAPLDVEGYLLLGKALLHGQGDRTGALREYQAALDLDPRNMLPYICFGDLYREQGDHLK